MPKILTIGECLMRLSSPVGKRLKDTPSLDVNVGGAEYNVAYNLATLGHDVSYASKIPKNIFGDKVFNIMRSLSVDTHSLLRGDGRLGIYFLDTGVGNRSSKVVYDRAYSVMSLMEEMEWDYDVLFEGITHLHLTGITLAISKFWHSAGLEIIKEAKKRGIFISFDMNYRASMWTVSDAKQVFNELIPYEDALSASHLDAKVFFDILLDESATNFDYIREIGNKFSNLKYIYGTQRHIVTSNAYSLTGFLLDNQVKDMFTSHTYDIQVVVDRVGTGDS